MRDRQDPHEAYRALVGLIDPNDAHAWPRPPIGTSRPRLPGVELQAPAASEDLGIGAALHHLALERTISQRRDDLDRQPERRLDLVLAQAPIRQDVRLFIG